MEQDKRPGAQFRQKWNIPATPKLADIKREACLYCGHMILKDQEFTFTRRAFPTHTLLGLAHVGCIV